MASDGVRHSLAGLQKTVNGAAGHLRRLGLLGLCLAVGLLAVAAVAMASWNSNPATARQVVATSVETQGFTPQGASFNATPGAGDLHLISASIPVLRGSRYVFSFRVAGVPDEPVTIFVDLYGVGYDDPAQERTFQVGYGSSGLRPLKGSFNSGHSAPTTAAIRIFYYGPVGLSVDSISVAAVPAWRTYLQILVTGCFALSLLSLAFSVVHRIFDESGQIGPGAAVTPTRIPMGLIALYPAFVLARFLVSLALPYWSGDEYVYKALAAGIWAHGSAANISPDQIAHSTQVPNLLYPYVISPAISLGEDFYLGIRLINAFILGAAMFPAFAIARRFVASGPALLLALLSVVIPSANIAAYAVTEVLYHSLFITSVWLAMRAIDVPGSFWRHVAFGLAAGVALNVRLNAMVIVPAYLVAIGLLALRERSGERLWQRPMWIVVVGTMIMVWRGLQSLLTPDNLSGLGVYESHTGGWLSSALSAMVDDPLGTWRLLSGHLTILTVPYSIGMATLLAIAFGQSRNDSGRRNQRDAVLLMCFFVLSIGLAIAFTLGVSSVDLGGVGRWHSRYYFSALPLLLVGTLMHIARHKDGRLSAWVYWTAISVHGIGFIYFVYFFKGLEQPWFGSMVDSMEVQWLRLAWGLPALLLVVTIAAAMLHWKMRRPHVTVGLLLVWVALANYGSFQTLRRSPGNEQSQCGKLAFHFLSQSPGRVVAVASSRAALVDIVFWLPLLPERSIVVPEGSAPFDARTLVASDYLVTDQAVHVVGTGAPITSGGCRIYALQ